MEPAGNDMARHRTARGFVAVAALAVLAAVSSCGLKDQSAPSMVGFGPSELGLSLNLQARPDVLPVDGGSSATILAKALDGTGQAWPNVSLRADIECLQARCLLAEGVDCGKPGTPTDAWTYERTVVDFGALTTKMASTGSNGEASIVYTAPSNIDPIFDTWSSGRLRVCAPGDYDGAPTDSDQLFVWIVITPTGGGRAGGWDQANAWPREVKIRLVDTPEIAPPNGAPVPSFNVSGLLVVGSSLTFDASASTDDGTIVQYKWLFGDGSTTTREDAVAWHAYDTAGAFPVTLTVTDNLGLSVSTTKTVTIGAGDAMTAAFTVSPSSGTTATTFNFNAGTSTPATGRTIVSYAWDFGCSVGSGQCTVGSIAPNSSPTASTRFLLAGGYTVTLTVTDDQGNKKTTTGTVTVS